MAAWLAKENVINCATSPGLWHPVARPSTPTSPKRCMFKTEDLIARPLTPTIHTSLAAKGHIPRSTSDNHDLHAFHLEDFALQRTSLAGAGAESLERALLTAAKDGNTAQVQRLIDLGAHPEAIDEHGFTPLHFACLNGHVETVKLLLTQRAKSDVASNDDHTPHSMATVAGNHAVLEVLLSHREIGSQPIRKERHLPPWLKEEGRVVVSRSAPSSPLLRPVASSQETSKSQTWAID